MKTFNHQQSLLKSKMDSKTLTLGSWLTIPHQSIVEILASAGFEWLVLDLEHSAIDFQKTQEMMGHIQAQGMQGLVRVSSNEPVVIKRSMDIGADGVIVPMVLNQHEAQKEFSEIRVIGKLFVFIVRVVVWIEVGGEFFRVPCWEVVEVGPPRVSSTN